MNAHNPNDPLFSLKPPSSYSSPDGATRHFEACEAARKTQLHPIAVAPNCSVPLHDGRRLETGDEIRPEFDLSWYQIRRLVENKVLVQISPEQAETNRKRLTARYVVSARAKNGSPCSLMTFHGVRDFGDAIEVADLDRGPQSYTVLGPPTRLGTGPGGEGLYAPGEVVKQVSVTAKQSRENAEKHFNELLAMGAITDRKAAKGAA